MTRINKQIFIDSAQRRLYMTGQIIPNVDMDTHARLFRMKTITTPSYIHPETNLRKGATKLKLESYCFQLLK